MSAISAVHRQKSADLVEASRQRGYGPQTPRAERDAEIRRLAAAGALTPHIAKLFEVTDETVRIVIRRLVTRALSEGEWALIQQVRAGNLDPDMVRLLIRQHQD